MPPGSFPHRVRIYKPVAASSDGIGNQAAAWEEIDGAWARIEPLKGKEYWAAAQSQGEATHRMTLRPAPEGLCRSCEIASGARRFEIAAPPIVGEGRGAEATIMCKERS